MIIFIFIILLCILVNIIQAYKENKNPKGVNIIIGRTFNNVRFPSQYIWYNDKEGGFKYESGYISKPTIRSSLYYDDIPHPKKFSDEYKKNHDIVINLRQN